MKADKVISFLKNYDGPRVKLMEVCGTHTASIFKSGIRDILSPKIRLISGPGCPVCVTPTAYIDKCMEYAGKDGHVLVTFGDMMKVPGSSGSLSECKGEGARADLMYSPFEVIEKAEKAPETTYVIAAVGFETTAPAYALLMREIRKKGIRNIKLLTALKTVIPALRRICEDEKEIDGFICPGHVSVITGVSGYESLSAKYGRPFAITGFEPEHILASVYELVFELSEGKTPKVSNLYKSAVKDGGNVKAAEAIAECFERGDAVWRGIGKIENSGMYLKGEYSMYDAGSLGLDEDGPLSDACMCGSVITGRINPDECPVFAKACNPAHPMGPCMVSGEGACGIWFRNV